MYIFYTPDILTVKELPEEEAAHCIRVLRLNENDEIMLTDGKGCFYKAKITDPHPKHCKVEIIETIAQQQPWKNNIYIAMAPTKNIDRTEWFVEKSTEMGVNQISFLNCRFSERKEIKLSRIKKILVAAMKQSLKATLPQLQEMTNFETFISKKFDGQKFIAHCHPTDKALLCNTYDYNKDILILIGPEGDFSENEVKNAIQQGFRPISLGETRLRTETAALVACQTIHIVNQIHSSN